MLFNVGQVLQKYDIELENNDVFIFFWSIFECGFAWIGHMYVDIFVFFSLKVKKWNEFIPTKFKFGVFSLKDLSHLYTN